MKWLIALSLSLVFVLSGCDRVKALITGEPLTKVTATLDLKKNGFLIGGTLLSYNNFISKTQLTQGKVPIVIQREVKPGVYTITFKLKFLRKYTYAFTVEKGELVKEIRCYRPIYKVKCYEVK